MSSIRLYIRLEFAAFGERNGRHGWDASSLPHGCRAVTATIDEVFITSDDLYRAGKGSGWWWGIVKTQDLPHGDGLFGQFGEYSNGGVVEGWCGEGILVGADVGPR